MKIDCQEHYDKVVEYAKSIGDTTFQNCINARKTIPWLEHTYVKK